MKIALVPKDKKRKFIQICGQFYSTVTKDRAETIERKIAGENALLIESQRTQTKCKTPLILLFLDLGFINTSQCSFNLCK